MQLFAEKRRFPRLELRIPVHCSNRGTTECCDALSNNIGLGGLGFSNDRFIAPNTIVLLKFSILSRVINATARVAWANTIPHSNRYKIGLEFLEIEPLEKNYLSDYIDMQMQGYKLLETERTV